jgi:uncharacterized coiled-coil protein SlyX
MDEETLERIQTRIAYLERSNTELSDVVFRQQQELQALAARLKHVSQQLEALDNSDVKRDLQAERPPHY